MNRILVSFPGFPDIYCTRPQARATNIGRLQTILVYVKSLQFEKVSLKEQRAQNHSTTDSGKRIMAGP